MSSYVELHRTIGFEESLRIALPDEITRDIAFRQDGGWFTALHSALRAHRPRGGERFLAALDCRGTSVLFEVPARLEGDPPIHVVRWIDEAPPPPLRGRPSKPIL